MDSYTRRCKCFRRTCMERRTCERDLSVMRLMPITAVKQGLTIGPVAVQTVRSGAGSPSIRALLSGRKCLGRNCMRTRTVHMDLPGRSGRRTEAHAGRAQARSVVAVAVAVAVAVRIAVA